MSEILRPGYIRWDGFKYVTDPGTLGGQAGGDLLGDFPNPEVIKLQGTALDITNPSDAQVLTWVANNQTWNPTSWQVSNIAQLLVTAPLTTTAVITVQGYYNPADGGGGNFVWNAADTRAPDGGTVFQVTGLATGRWNRVSESLVDIRAFGAIGDGQAVTDGVISTGLNATILSCSTSSPFKSTDVGKLISVRGAGAGGAALITTIATYLSSSQVTLAIGCSTSVSHSDVRWGTDNLSKINAAISSATSPLYAKSVLYIPRQAFAVSGEIQVYTHGLTMVGDCRQRGANSFTDASIIMLLGSAPFLISFAGAHHQIRGVWFHGGNCASSRTVDFTYSNTFSHGFGVGAFTESLIENCVISNAASTTSDLIACLNNLQVNKIVVRGCTIRQDPIGNLLNGTTEDRCRYWFNNPNGNAFEISFYDCIFYNAATAGICFQASIADPVGNPPGTFPAGSAYFYSCEFYDYTGPVFLYECCRHFSVINCYTEAGSYPFFMETNVYPNFSWTETILIENTVMNTGGFCLILQRKQPFHAINCGLGGPLQVGNAGNYWPILDNCGLLPQDYASGIIHLTMIDHPERIILRGCTTIVFQEFPGSAFQPVVNVWDHDPSQGWISPLPFSVYGNARTGIDGVTNGTNVFTSSSANFQPNDIGRQIIIYSESAGIRWAVYGIIGVTNSTTVTLSSTAPAATGVIWNLGGTIANSEQTALLAAANAAFNNNLELRFPPGIYMCASQTFPPCAMHFMADGYFLITGAGSSGATVSFSGKITTQDGHNVFLGQYGPTVLVSSSYANYLITSDTVQLSGLATHDVSGNFDQFLLQSEYGSSIIQVTDSHSHLTGKIIFWLPQFEGTLRTIRNETAYPLFLKPLNSGGTGFLVLPGHSVLAYFDGTNIAPGGTIVGAESWSDNTGNVPMTGSTIDIVTVTVTPTITGKFMLQISITYYDSNTGSINFTVTDGTNTLYTPYPISISAGFTNCISFTLDTDLVASPQTYTLGTAVTFHIQGNGANTAEVFAHGCQVRVIEKS